MYNQENANAKKEALHTHREAKVKKFDKCQEGMNRQELTGSPGTLELTGTPKS